MPNEPYLPPKLKALMAAFMKKHPKATKEQLARFMRDEAKRDPEIMDLVLDAAFHNVLIEEADRRDPNPEIMRLRKEWLSKN
jgi:hypothetical protein